MKKHSFPVILILLVTIVTSCNKEKYGTFSVSVGDKVWITDTDIDFYDFSSQLVYLKHDNLLSIDPEEFLKTYQGPFSVLLGGEEIYNGNFQPGYSSAMYPGAYIPVPGFYGKDIFSISYLKPPDGKMNDPRYDSRIISTLKRINLYHAGLSCTIDDIKVIDNDQVADQSHIQYTFTIENKDDINYYILDPNLTGNELFHFFTNGMILHTSDYQRFYEYIGPHTTPEPWDSVKPEWLTLLESGKKLSRTLLNETYNYLDQGQYICKFTYPGAGYQVSRNERELAHGRIWLGEITSTSEITIE